MNETLLFAVILLWVIVLVLCAVVIALLRQIGVIHERIAPAGALMLGGGPKVGEEMPGLELQTLDGRPMTLGGENPAGKSTLLFFLSPHCPVCKTLLPVLKSSQRAESKWLDIVLASDGDMQEQHRFVEMQRLQQFPYVVSSQLGLSLQVGKLPYVVLVDEQGIIRGKGLVNSREHLESVFEAKERGVESIQEYLKQQLDQAV